MTTLSNESFTLIETTAKSTSTFSIKEDNSNAALIITIICFGMGTFIILVGCLLLCCYVRNLRQKQSAVIHTIERKRQHKKHLQKYNQMRNSYNTSSLPQTPPPIFEEDPSTVSTSDGYAYVNNAFAKDGTITIISDENKTSAKSIPPGQKFIVIENGKKKALRNYTIE